VHDYLDILGLSHAPANEVRRACRGRVRRSHPDFRDEGDAGALTSVSAVPSTLRNEADVAVDFADMAVFVDRMQAAFFAAGR
jgi:hypothetical protein